MKATRERKIEFMQELGYARLEKAIARRVRKVGAENFLTDEQLDEIVSEEVSDLRFTRHLNMLNRRNVA
ncbi:hypothetical protein JYP52_23605 [Nitratireductor aquibiodomus]|uniref:hypothetical protein n=1 Tax=Nitratireductor aquibiodomus TaxID=204799 RepID=UPI0019D3AFFE|nr:hypothetical protein [Nitratireductor aquibiodomus]MBN7764119.1 hypothetical protein [Nitratireductor aquibiodomus]